MMLLVRESGLTTLNVDSLLTIFSLLSIEFFHLLLSMEMKEEVWLVHLHQLEAAVAAELQQDLMKRFR